METVYSHWILMWKNSSQKIILGTKFSNLGKENGKKDLFFSLNQIRSFKQTDLSTHSMCNLKQQKNLRIMTEFKRNKLFLLKHVHIKRL